MAKKTTQAKATAEEPKRIFKETIKIQVPKTEKEKKQANEKLQELVMLKFSLEKQIEDCKKKLAGMKYDLSQAAEEAASETKEEDVEATIKIYAKSMKKEIWIKDQLHATEKADRYELQADIDDLNYQEEDSDDNDDDSDDDK